MSYHFTPNRDSSDLFSNIFTNFIKSKKTKFEHFGNFWDRIKKSNCVKLPQYGQIIHPPTIDFLIFVPKKLLGHLIQLFWICNHTKTFVYIITTFIWIRDHWNESCEKSPKSWQICSWEEIWI